MHPPRRATFRFYEELNDFLPAARRKVDFDYRFSGNPSVKDAIESIGIPHSEVDLVLVNRTSVDFGYHLNPEDRVSVYPVFESLDISGVTRLQKRPLRKPRFILDVHLGKLARYLRLFGFDTLYRNDFEDAQIVRMAEAQRRIVLTRDRGLLMQRRLSRGYWVRATDPRRQLREVMHRFHLGGIRKPFSRCLECNGLIRRVRKDEVRRRLLPKTERYYRRFYGCRRCGRVYWNGSHYEKMHRFVSEVGSWKSVSRR